MLGVLADDANDAAAVDDFAFVADLFDGGADLHLIPFFVERGAGWNKGMSQGLEPTSNTSLNVRAEALTYLKCKSA